jgi:hypothetical protein
MSAEERPFMNRDDVAELLGVQGKTISTYLYESGVEIGKKKRRGRYAGHPFPAPDAYHGKAPWWGLDRRTEILTWDSERPGQGVGGGRPRQSD